MKKLVLLLISAILTTSLYSDEVVIYDNIQGSSTMYAGYVIGTMVGMVENSKMGFEVENGDQRVKLSSITLGVRSQFEPGEMKVEFFTDSDGDQLPDRSIGSATALVTDGVYEQVNFDLLFSNINFESNNPYWVTVAAVDESSTMGWLQNTLNYTAPSVMSEAASGNSWVYSSDNGVVGDMIIKAIPIGAEIDETLTISECRINSIYPNPFNPETTINFDLKSDTDLKIDVYDISGRYLTTLAEKKFSAGDNSINWNIKDSNQPLSSGIYFIRLKSKSFNLTNRVTLLQ